jgi:hypothetical protein
MYLIGVETVAWFGFLYFAMVDTAIPTAVFIAIVLSLGYSLFRSDDQ